MARGLSANSKLPALLERCWLVWIAGAWWAAPKVSALCGEETSSARGQRVTHSSEHFPGFPSVIEQEAVLKIYLGSEQKRCSPTPGSCTEWALDCAGGAVPVCNILWGTHNLIARLHWLNSVQAAGCILSTYIFSGQRSTCNDIFMFTYYC